MLLALKYLTNFRYESNSFIFNLTWPSEITLHMHLIILLTLLKLLMNIGGGFAAVALDSSSFSSISEFSLFLLLVSWLLSRGAYLFIFEQLAIFSKVFCFFAMLMIFVIFLHFIVTTLVSYHLHFFHILKTYLLLFIKLMYVVVPRDRYFRN